MKAWVLIPFFASLTCSASAQAGAGGFSLLTWKCQPEEASEVEATPQSPPLDVDDPGTPGCNQWEINATFDGDITQGAANWELPLLDVNYGIGDNLQLKYEVPYVKSQVDDLSLGGVGTSKAGIKYKFFDDEATDFEMAIYPQLDFVTPGSRGVEKGLSAPGTITTIPLLVSRKIGELWGGDLSMSANLAYNQSSRADTRSFVSAAAGLGAPLFSKVALMGELTTEQAVRLSDDGTRDSLLKADLGAMGMINKEMMIYGSIGHSIYSSDQLDHTYVVAGIQVLTNWAPKSE